MSYRRRGTLLAAAVSAAALVTAGCSSSGASSSSAGGSGSATASGAGTITIGVPCQISGPQVSPECATAVQAYFAQLNAHGGINGHKVNVLTCDTQSSPVVGEACARSFDTNSKVVALLNEGGIAATLPTDLPLIGPLVEQPGEPTQNNSFPISGYAFGGLGDFKTDYHYGASHGVTKFGVLSCTLSGCIGINQQLNAYFSDEHASLKLVSAPLTIVSLGPEATVLQNSGVTEVLLDEASAGDIGFLTSSNAIGYHPTVGFAFNCFDQNVLNEVPTSSTAICPTPFNLTPSNMAQYEAALNAYAGTGKWNNSVYAMNGWLASQLFVADVKGITGAVTRTSVLNGMSKVTDFSSPLLAAPIDFSKTGPVGSLPAIRYFYFYPDVVKNHSLVAAAQAVNVAG